MLANQGIAQNAAIGNRIEQHFVPRSRALRAKIPMEMSHSCAAATGKSRAEIRWPAATNGRGSGHEAVTLGIANRGWRLLDTVEQSVVRAGKGRSA
jgi:hypothetical protein